MNGGSGGVSSLQAVSSSVVHAGSWLPTHPASSPEPQGLPATATIAIQHTTPRTVTAAATNRGTTAARRLQTRACFDKMTVFTGVRNLTIKIRSMG